MRSPPHIRKGFPYAAATLILFHLLRLSMGLKKSRHYCVAEYCFRKATLNSCITNEVILDSKKI